LRSQRIEPASLLQKPLQSHNSGEREPWPSFVNFKKSSLGQAATSQIKNEVVNKKLLSPTKYID
jgi:hypothetical protein